MGAVEDVKRVLAQAGIHLMYNTFVDRPSVIVDGGQEHYLGDLDRAKIVIAVHDAKLKVHGPILDACIMDIAHSSTYHPVQDYLNNQKWDGTPRIDTWLIDYMGADDTPLVRAVGAIVLIAAVRRVRQPGCKFDECLVMVGKEGVGKSETIKALGGEWFSDSLPLGADPKITVERTEGVWLCESAELVGNTPTKIAEIKAFLSRQIDGPYRKAYGRESDVRKRQFIPIATTNDSVFLHSVTGDRRFWPIKVYTGMHEKVMVDRNQLWAKAAQRERLGESIRLVPDLWDAAYEEQEKYRAEDPWETKLRQLSGPTISLLNIWGHLGIPADRQHGKDAQRIAGIMTKMGYLKSRKLMNGVRTTYYEISTPFHPENFDRSPGWVDVEAPVQEGEDGGESLPEGVYLEHELEEL